VNHDRCTTPFTQFPAPIKKLVCGNLRTWYLCENGQVYGSGEYVARIVTVPNSATPPPDAISQLGLEELNETYFVHDVVCGENHVFFVCQAKNEYYGSSVSSMGDHQSRPVILTMGVQGQYSSGLRSSATVDRPIVHPQLNRDDFPVVVNVFCGPQASAVLCADGSVWFSGCSRGGNLGEISDESDTARSRQPQYLMEFTRFEYLSSIPHAIKSIALGYSHTIFLTVTGQCYGIGMNDSCQLGLEQTPERNRTKHVPHMIKIQDDSFIEDVKCGNNHTIFLDYQKRVLFCGNNFHGECGQEPKAERRCQSVKESPLIQKLVGMTSIRDALDRKSIVFPDSVDSVVKDPPSRIQTIAAGSWHSICTTDDNRIVACGYNSVNQLFFSLPQAVTLQRACIFKLSFVENKMNMSRDLEMRVACGQQHSVLYFVRSKMKSQEFSRNLLKVLTMGNFCDISICIGE